MNIRKQQLMDQLREFLGELGGQDLSATPPSTAFLDLGLDSLFLTQAASGMKSRFGVKITFRQLLESLTSIEAIANYLDEQLPSVAANQEAATPQVMPTPAASAPSSKSPLAVSAPSRTVGTHHSHAASAPPILLSESTPFITILASTASTSAVERVVQEQLQLMEQQLALLRQSTRSQSAAAIPTTSQSSSSGGISSFTPGSESCPSSIQNSASPAPPAPRATAPQAAGVAAAASQHGPFRQIDKSARGGLTEQQQTHLDGFIPRYLKKSPRSREYTNRFRKPLADPRAVSGFKQNWKEMVYPIVSVKSAGANLWDLDGNQWVDVTMGFGVALLGHSPAFITEAIRKQLDAGVEIGPQSPLAGEVAELICEFTGMERVTFCNTGSEAVMAALRICRTVTGRQKIVLFAGAYHGTFDEVLVKGTRVKGEPRTLPIAPGVAPNLIASVVVLDYGTQESLEWIRQHADTLAAVLVETVQSRHPDLQPKEFLLELRKITQSAETPLIFDEVITGFRCHPGGAQKYFGIEADLATYGKIVGGGMPFGFIAGKSWLMDAFDGGAWQYGDDSFPPSGVTFFAGTFVRHPLAMAAAKAVLLHLREAGPTLQSKLAERTDRMLRSLNDYFERHQVPLHLEHFTSVWYPHWGSEVKHGSLLFYHLREKGLHIWEGRPCFLSTAHTAEDEAFIEQAFKRSVAEMQLGGFLTGTSDPEYIAEAQANRSHSACTFRHGTQASIAPHPDTDHSCSSSRPEIIPLTEGQKEMWLSTQLNPEASGTFNASCLLHFEGDVDADALQSAIQQTVTRHEALRATLLEDGSGIQIAPHIDISLDRYDLRERSGTEREARKAQILHQAATQLFSLSKGPLFHTSFIHETSNTSLLTFTINMIVCDGWGINVVLEEIAEIYSASQEKRSARLKPVVPLRAYSEWLNESDQLETAEQSLAFWTSRLEGSPHAVELPTSGARPQFRTVSGARESQHWDRDFTQRIRDLAKARGSTPFSVLFAAYQAWLYKVVGQSDLIIGVPLAGQSTMNRPRIVNQCVQTLPIRVRLDRDQSFASCLQTQRNLILEAQENWNCSFGSLSAKLQIEEDPSRLPLVSVLFNVDPPMSGIRFAGLKHQISSGPRAHFQYDLGLNIVDLGDTFIAELDYNRDLFDPEQVAAWLQDIRGLLEAALTNPALLLNDLPAPSPLIRSSANRQRVEPTSQSAVSSSEARKKPLAPRTPTERRLAAIWATLLRSDTFGIQDNFFELGGRSLKAVALFAEIEKQFGRKLPLATLLKCPTIETLASSLDCSNLEKTATDETHWHSLIPLQQAGSKPKLFLVHGAGGNVLLYQALAKHLAPDYPLFGLQSQGLDGKTPPLLTIESMAQRYLEEVRREQPHGPYFLGGYCMGGTIAYEMAQQLLAAGETVQLVALLDTYNFALVQYPTGVRCALQKIGFHFRNLTRLSPKEIGSYLAEKVRVAREGEWIHLFATASSDSPKPHESSSESVREPRVQESNDQACLAYQPQRYAGELTLFRPQVNYDFYPDPQMGWGDLVQGGIINLELAVNPHAMLVEPFVSELAKLLKTRIDDALTASSQRSIRKAA